jgi:hypothetical protein
MKIKTKVKASGINRIVVTSGTIRSPHVRVKFSSFPCSPLTYIYNPERTPFGAGRIYQSGRRRWSDGPPH